MKRDVISEIAFLTAKSNISQISTIQLFWRNGILLRSRNMFSNQIYPDSFIIYFRSFQTNIITVLQQIYVKKCHQVYDAGIRTQDLWNTSLLP